MQFSNGHQLRHYARSGRHVFEPNVSKHTRASGLFAGTDCCAVYARCRFTSINKTHVIRVINEITNGMHRRIITINHIPSRQTCNENGSESASSFYLRTLSLRARLDSNSSLDNKNASDVLSILRRAVQAYACRTLGSSALVLTLNSEQTSSGDEQ